MNSCSNQCPFSYLSRLSVRIRLGMVPAVGLSPKSRLVSASSMAALTVCCYLSRWTPTISAAPVNPCPQRRIRSVRWAFHGPTPHSPIRSAAEAARDTPSRAAVGLLGLAACDHTMIRNGVSVSQRSIRPNSKRWHCDRTMKRKKLTSLAFPRVADLVSRSDGCLPTFALPLASRPGNRPACADSHSRPAR